MYKNDNFFRKLASIVEIKKMFEVLEIIGSAKS